MIDPGDVVTASFPGVTGVKRRPCVVVSSPAYHQTRPDVILGLLTTQIPEALAPSDYILQDWPAAGLHKPCAFRTFLFTIPTAAVTVIGSLTQRDWDGVRQAARSSIAGN